MKYFIQILFLCYSLTAFSQSGLVSFLSFDNNDLTEESGNGQNGIFSTPNPSFSCGVKGQALVFNGTSDQLTIFGLNNILNKNDFTISFYFKPDATLSTQILLSKRELCNNQNAMGIDYITSSNGIDYLFSENSSKSLLFKEFLDPNVCWNHLVFVREESKSRLYLNGVLIEEKNSVTRLNIENAAELIFGGGPCLSPSTVPFKGLLDEVKIFRTAISHKEVEDLYLEPHRITTQRDTLIFLGTSLDVQSNEACAGAFFWSPIDGVDNPTISNPTITATETTVYTLDFDIGGCIARDSILVKVVDPNDLDCNQIFLPSAFTPNSDGRNETYGLSNPFALEELITFEIFDQWGGRVFYTTDVFAKWDGTSKNELLNPGVYLYRVYYRCNGVEQTKTGSVTLLR